MIEKLEFQGNMWQVIAKVEGHRLGDPSTLKKSYGADMVIRNPQNIYFVLNKIIDVEYEEV